MRAMVCRDEGSRLGQASRNCGWRNQSGGWRGRGISSSCGGPLRHYNYNRLWCQQRCDNGNVDRKGRHNRRKLRPLPPPPPAVVAVPAEEEQVCGGGGGGVQQRCGAIVMIIVFMRVRGGPVNVRRGSERGITDGRRWIDSKSSSSGAVATRRCKYRVLLRRRRLPMVAQ